MEQRDKEIHGQNASFHARDIPLAVRKPRFRKIMQKNQQRREEVKQQSFELLKKMEKPFSFYKRDVEHVTSVWFNFPDIVSSLIYIFD